MKLYDHHLTLGFVWNEAFLRQVQSSEIQSTGTISFKRRFHIYHEKSAGKSKIYVSFYHIIISFEIMSSVLCAPCSLAEVRMWQTS